MTDSLPVHVSREKLHSLEVQPSFETSGSFDIRLINHGESLHIHLHLDDPLSEVATLDAGNHFVEGETERYVRVDIDTEKLDGESHLGKLKVASAYGAQTRWIDVKVTEPDPEAEKVQVDEALASPQPQTEPEAGILDRSAVPVLVLGAIALLLAGTAAILFQDVLIALGALVVLGGVAGALFFLFRDEPEF